MKTLLATAVGLMLVAGSVWAVGPRGGGGGRVGGGGGGARPNIGGGGGVRPGGGGGGISRPSAPNFTPSFSGARPSAPAGRPNPPQINRPNPPQINRPSTLPANPGARPGMVPGSRPNLPTTRPNLPTTRPGGQTPSLPTRPNLPGGGPSVGLPNRPGTGGPGIGGPGPGRPNIPGIGTNPGRPGLPGGSPGPVRPGDPGRPGGALGGIGGPGGIGSLPNRPGITPKTLPGDPGRFPNINRPGGGINIGDINRPGGGINIGDINRPNINRPNINTGDRNVNINNNWNNWNVNRPAVRPVVPPPYRPNWNHWQTGSWRPWYNNPGLWFGTGVAYGWLTSPGQTVVYSNPYFVQPPATQIIYNYSDPLPPPVIVQSPPPTDVPIDEAPAPASTAEESTNDEAVRNFDAARAAFKVNDFAKALDLVNASIKLLPSDATLHEFRALVLFATKEYPDAASTIYSVLAVGPGWDWDTVKSLYDQPSTYVQQLRALEAYQKANPKAGYASFLLAYHYLMLDSIPQAITQLENTIASTPGDELSKLLLKSLQDRDGRPAPAAAP